MFVKRYGKTDMHGGKMKFVVMRTSKGFRSRSYRRYYAVLKCAKKISSVCAAQNESSSTKASQCLLRPLHAKWYHGMRSWRKPGLMENLSSDTKAVRHRTGFSAAICHVFVRHGGFPCFLGGHSLAAVRYDVVSLFVNDTADGGVLKSLGAFGIKMVAMR